ncbi:hypothetical protein [Streptomyces rhizosphaericus]|uniref:Uncharacterized protein n=1 Tax=Streptomyces rhizosphaericus TaxID=114699 RepID=A0A6G4AIX2_9ACTN|nr:hypothetical protein [Streptomyces rhizosphaericus]NEW72447.1 hypothetical protein [Streptomyces rhizosphaericus]
MQERIARLVEWLLRLVLHAPCRHCAVGARPVLAYERQCRTAGHGVKAVAL